MNIFKNSTNATSLINTSTSSNSANVSEFTIKDINLKEVKLSEYNGKVIMIVNVASKCGFTSQYKGLQDIYDKYKDHGI